MAGVDLFLALWSHSKKTDSYLKTGVFNQSQPLKFNISFKYIRHEF